MRLKKGHSILPFRNEMKCGSLSPAPPSPVRSESAAPVRVRDDLAALSVMTLSLRLIQSVNMQADRIHLKDEKALQGWKKLSCRGLQNTRKTEQKKNTYYSKYSKSVGKSLIGVRDSWREASDDDSYAHVGFAATLAVKLHFAC
ncbi:hypothetical protein TNCV_4352801 [Trichonephila clavipes]|nr:hypothetical protein TNCV_4352801 [Trichonephila clavipes]